MSLQYSFLLILTITIWGCSEKKTIENKNNSPFLYFEKNISFDTKLVLPQLTRSHEEFNNILKTVLYNDKLISLTDNGGLICLNADNFKINKGMNKKLNMGYFTNLTLFQDTLIVEKSEKTYYLNSDFEWVEYTRLFPIKYFDILYDDSNYVFYYTDCGEWGSLLFIYDKKVKITRVLFCDAPLNVFKTDNSFFINTISLHESIRGAFFTFKNPELIKHTVIEPSLYYDCNNDNWMDNYHYNCYECVKRVEYEKIHEHYRKDLKLWSPPAILSSFIYNDNLYNFVMGLDSIYISKIENYEYKTIQSIKKFKPTITRKFGNTVILNEYYGGDVIIVKNNAITRIHFSPVK
ncbi:MAG: hypothetical protein RO257_10470 [Candidatus Kapabacteria bacterium]|nr:hypothetical protein [Candidatus Kapabacteria bacterium]